MLFENFVLKRLILHEVFQRRPDRVLVPPRYGGQLIKLDQEASDVFRKRVVDALGSAGQSMEMSIVDVVADSAVQISATLVDAADPEFIELSKGLANKLAHSQLGINLPGGVLIVFDGTAGNPSKKVVGILKAETHTGFRRHLNGDLIEVEFFNDLFLSPQTKLYKIGAFIRTRANPMGQLPNGWRALVYDSLMSSSNRQAAAQYFYENFLGCSIPANSAQLTKKFFDGTSEFIRKIDFSPQEKADLFTGLYTYLKLDQTPTIELQKFADTYLPAKLKDDYQSYMKDQKFPNNAIKKDTSDIGNSLRQRKVVFHNSVRLVATPEDFENLIVLETIDGPKNKDGTSPEWTRITVKDRVQSQS